MSKLEKYSSYKESGVEWLGAIPGGWEVKKLKFISKIKTGYTPDTTKVNNYIENGTVWVKPDNLNEFTLIYDSKEKISLKGVKKQNIIPKGSLLVNCIGTIGKFGIAGVDLITNQQINAVIFNTLIENNFGKYLIFASNSEHNKYSNGNVVQILNTSAQGIIKFAIPPKQEQTKIASFLDTKTEQLDIAIKQKEQLIELLKERRQILINDAVTKGIDKTVAMKDSDVEWIGEIPEHWEIVSGFTVYKENKTKNTGMKDDRVLSLSYGKIVVKPKEKLTGLVPESFETYQIVKPGDIIIRCMDLQNDQTSLRTAISINDGIITSAYLNLNIIDDFNSDYLHYYLHSLDITKVLYKFGSGLRQNLSYEDFKRLPIVKPSKVKQQKIVEYIENNNQKIDKAIDLQQQQIIKLKEYKTTLIDSVVTGKVKVS